MGAGVMRAASRPARGCLAARLKHACRWRVGDTFVEGSHEVKLRGAEHAWREVPPRANSGFCPARADLACSRVLPATFQSSRSLYQRVIAGEAPRMSAPRSEF